MVQVCRIFRLRYAELCLFWDQSVLVITQQFANDWRGYLGVAINMVDASSKQFAYNRPIVCVFR